MPRDASETSFALHKAWLIDLIKRKFPKARILAFGSRVKGGAKPYSDLDLSIDNGGESLPAGEFFDLLEVIAESDIPYKVDLSDYSELSEDFKAHIKSECVEWK